MGQRQDRQDGQDIPVPCGSTPGCLIQRPSPRNICGRQWAAGKRRRVRVSLNSPMSSGASGAWSPWFGRPPTTTTGPHRVLGDQSYPTLATSTPASDCDLCRAAGR